MASECSLICYFKTKNFKKFWGGAQPLPSPYLLGACSTSIFMPLALAPTVQKS